MLATMSYVTRSGSLFTFFFFNDTATTEIYTLSLHDALPISFRIALTLLGGLLALMAVGRFALEWWGRPGDVDAVSQAIRAAVQPHYPAPAGGFYPDHSPAGPACRLPVRPPRRRHLGHHRPPV